MAGRIPPDGLDPLTVVDDGYYLVQKSGGRFRDWIRLLIGTGLSETLGDHTLTISRDDPTPLVTVVGGAPGLVFDSDGQIVYTELP